MAYTVYIGSFSKKVNSTAQPNYTEWARYSCVLKDETSLYRPTLSIATSFENYANYKFNYAVMLGRYYWITDVRSIRTNLIELDLQLDPLATYKTNILGTSAFIEYGFNSADAGAAATRFVDSRLPVSENPTMSVAQFDPSGGLISPLTGTFVLQAVGNNPNGAHKGLATFALTGAQLARMMTSISTGLSNSIDSILNNSSMTAQEVMNYITAFSLKQELLNESAMAAIQSVKWLPFDINALQISGGTQAALYLGNYPTGITDAIMLEQNSTHSHLSAVDIPWPVDDWKRNNCQLVLYLPFFGTIPIPTDQAINTSAIGITWTCEFFSGSISVIVKCNNGQYIAYASSTNVAVDMGVGRSMVGTSQLIGGGLQAMGGVLQMAGGALDMGSSTMGSLIGISHFGEGASAIAAGAQNVYQGYAQTVQPAITCAGSMGGMAAIAQTTPGTITVVYYPPIDESGFSAVYGHPVFRVATPAAGFCKTRGFSISVNAPGAYTGYINKAMDGGVFIE